MKQSAKSRAFRAGSDRRRVLTAEVLLVAAVTFVVLLPSLNNPFVRWDDFEVLVNNRHYRGFAWENIRWMFTTFYMGHYQPLSWLSLALDHALWGMEPFGYHLTNLLLHTLNTVLCYLLTRRLLQPAIRPEGPRPWAVDAGAVFAALLFSIHPLRVESVVWATERRDVLSACFYLLSVLAYLRAHEARQEGRSSRGWMALAFAAAVMSILAKAIAVTLVAVLTVLDVYPLRRLGGEAGWVRGKARSVWVEKIPFLVLSVAAGVVAPLAQARSGAMGPLSQYGPGPRAMVALYGLSFYLAKTVWPAGLSPLYELPASWTAIDSRFILGGAIVLGAGVLFWLRRRRWPGLLAAWLCYVILLSPTLGFFQSGPQIAADRYTYLGCMGWAVLAGAVLTRCVEAATVGRLSKAGLGLVLGGALMVICALGVCTRRQVAVWSDSVTLWQRVLAVEPHSIKGNLHLGGYLLEAGRPAEAVPCFQHVVQLRPQESSGYAHLGMALLKLGRAAEAKSALKRALELNPEDGAAHFGLGALLLDRNELDASASHLQRAVELEPENLAVHLYYGNALYKKRDLEAAAAQYRKAIQLAEGLGKNELAVQLRSRLSSFTRREPHHVAK
jgi:Tfp pilus assembly protein PilF